MQQKLTALTMASDELNQLKDEIAAEIKKLDIELPIDISTVEINPQVLDKVARDLKSGNREKQRQAAKKIIQKV